MKKLLALLLALTLTSALTACSTEQDGSSSSSASSASSQSDQTQESSANSTANTENDSNILIAYFTMPEDVDTDGVDAIAGASIVVEDGEVMGNVEYMANVIQNTVGGELFQIETVQQYPLDHDSLVDQAADEQDENARPELASHIENPDQYDTIFLGYPDWWGDMPQALYTFKDRRNLLWNLQF